MADTSPLESIGPAILEQLTLKNSAREQGLAASRAIIRLSANSIRAVHRSEFSQAGALLDDARRIRDEASVALAQHPDVYFAGFLHDAQKEYAEARITLALLSGNPLPGPADLAVELPAYLNGLGEAIGELRRAILDRLRSGRFSGCEDLLRAMDDMYAFLTTVDFPDAMTAGLRRTTDQARGILERTRGDLTVAIAQQRTAERMGLPPVVSSELPSD